MKHGVKAVSLNAIFLLSVLALKTASAQEPIPLVTDTLLKTGIGYYLKGDYPKAREILEPRVEEKEKELDEESSKFSNSHPKLIAIIQDVSEGRKFLAFALVALGDTDGAKESFKKALSINPYMALDPLATAPKIMKIFESTKTESGLPGPEAFSYLTHHPSLFSIRGNPVWIYAKKDSGSPIEKTSLVYYSGPAGSEIWKLEPLEDEDGLIQWMIPGGVGLKSEVLRYRFESIGRDGKMRTTQWYPVRIAGSVSEIEEKTGEIKSEYSGPESDWLSKAHIKIDGHEGNLPEGVEVAESPGSAGVLNKAILKLLQAIF